MSARTITIVPALNGFVCQVGCQQVVFNDVAVMCCHITAYYKNPEAVEKSFIEQAVNPMNSSVPQPQGYREPAPFDTNMTAAECAQGVAGLRR